MRMKRRRGGGWDEAILPISSAGRFPQAHWWVIGNLRNFWSPLDCLSRSAPEAPVRAQEHFCSRFCLLTCYHRRAWTAQSGMGPPSPADQEVLQHILSCDWVRYEVTNSETLILNQRWCLKAGSCFDTVTSRLRIPHLIRNFISHCFCTTTPSCSSSSATCSCPQHH